MKKFFFLLTVIASTMMTSCNLNSNSPSRSGSGGSLPYQIWQCGDDNYALFLTFASGQVTYQEAHRENNYTVYAYGPYRISGSNIQFRFTSCSDPNVPLSTFPTTAQLIKDEEENLYILYNDNYFKPLK